MFSELEFVGGRASRRWTAVASYTLQAGLVAAALVLPLSRPEGLPEAFAGRRIFVPVPQGDRQVQVERSDVHSGTRAPVIPLIVSRRSSGPHNAGGERGVQDIDLPPSISTLGIGSGAAYSPGGDYVPPAPRQEPPARRPPISEMMEGNLLHRITPQYPALAKQLGIQGTVLIRAVISRTGTIEQTEVISGNSWLARAALDAVKGWRYRPYMLNGDPVEVETQITVKFVLDR